VNFLLYFIEHDKARIEHLEHELAQMQLPNNVHVGVEHGEFEDTLSKLVSVEDGNVLVPTSRSSIPSATRRRKCPSRSTDRHAAGRGRVLRWGASFVASLLKPGFGGGCAAPAAPCPRGRARARGVPLNIIQRQFGHVNLWTTSIHLQGIDTEEIIAAVSSRRAPMMPASAGLQF
jgi:hypothetical protein